MTQKFNLIDPDKAYDQLSNEIGRRAVRFATYKLILETFKSMEGKPLTWHLAKALEKKHPALKFSFEKENAWFSIVVTGEGMPALNLNIGYKGRVDGVDHATIEDQNRAYGLEGERIEQMQEELKTIEARVKRYNDALIEVNRAFECLGEGKHSFTENTSLNLKDSNDRWYME